MKNKVICAYNFVKTKYVCFWPVGLLLIVLILLCNAASSLFFIFLLCFENINIFLINKFCKRFLTQPLVQKRNEIPCSVLLGRCFWNVCTLCPIFVVVPPLLSEIQICDFCNTVLCFVQVNMLQ